MGNRQHLESVRRIVVKIGSRILANYDGIIPSISRQLAELQGTQGCQFLLVSSGAISIGCQTLGYKTRPPQMARLQAAAAAGQSELMRRYADALASHGISTAQVLLTHSDMASRRRVTNAQQALTALFEVQCVPIVNENDTVSTDEIAFGDNDQLASMVVPMVQADLLVLLTDVPGVLDATGARIGEMDDDAAIANIAPSDDPDATSHGTGGMTSKVSAARKACHFGASVVIAPAAEPDILKRIVRGDDVGTLFRPHGDTLRARQHWIAYTLKPRGEVLINSGAARALRGGKSSLLPVGVLGVNGQFSRGDAVRLLAPGGEEVGRGLARMALSEVARAAGKSTNEIQTRVGQLESVVVHRDDLVVFGD